MFAEIRVNRVRLSSKSGQFYKSSTLSQLQPQRVLHILCQSLLAGLGDVGVDIPRYADVGVA